RTANHCDPRTQRRPIGDGSTRTATIRRPLSFGHALATPPSSQRLHNTREETNIYQVMPFVARAALSRCCERAIRRTRPHMLHPVELLCLTSAVHQSGPLHRHLVCVVMTVVIEQRRGHWGRPYIPWAVVWCVG